MLRLVHFAGFQLGWFAAVLGAAGGNVWLGPLTLAGLTALHLFAISRRGTELLRLLAAAALGLSADTLLVVAGVLEFGPGSGPLPPPWMPGLWVIFTATLAVSMNWLRGRYRLGMLLGAVAGPVCYAAAERLGAVRIPLPDTVAFPAIALEWAVATPLLVVLTERAGGWIDLEAAPPHAFARRKPTP